MNGARTGSSSQRSLVGIGSREQEALEDLDTKVVISETVVGLK